MAGAGRLMYPTSARFRQVVAGSHRAAVRVQLLSSTQFGPTPVGGLELPILAGNVRLASTSDVKGTLDITVPGDYWESVQPYGAEIFAERGVDFGDGTAEYTPLGYYRIESVDQDDAPWGPVRVAAKDRTAQMLDARLVYPYNYPAGITHATLFDRLVNGYTDPTGSASGGPKLISYGLYHQANVPILFLGYDGTQAAFAAAGVVEDSIYEYMAKVVDARGCVLRFDRLGQLRIEPRDRAPGAQSVFTVAPGSAGNLVRASRRVSRAGIYNIVVARGSDPQQPTGYRLAYNNDRSSPLYWAGPFGAVPRYYASPLLRTYDAADVAAESILARYKGLPSGLAVVTAPDPSIDPLDPISVQVGASLQEHLSDEVTIPLTVPDPVQIVARTLNEIPTFEDEGQGGEVGNPDPGTGSPGGGSSGGAPLIAAKFRDGRAFPIIREVTGMQVVPVANSSELTAKLAAAAPNQKLVLSDGTYSGSFVASKAGTDTQPIVIAALNPGGPKLAAGSSIRLTGKYTLLTGVHKDFDDPGKSFSIESAAQFCRITRCRVGPATLGAPDPGATKSLHYYIGGTAQDCVIDYCESRNKSKPGNGVLVDGNFDGGQTGGCQHILLAHLDIHDYGTEVVNDFEAIRIGVSSMQETVSNSAVIRCVFTNIASEPEIISLKLDTIDSWGHTVRNCIGSLSSRHGSRNAYRHSYVFGPATGSAGTKAGGVRLYDDDIEVTDCYFEGLNGAGFQDTICVDGGDTTTGGTSTGHKQVRRAKILRNVLVGCATPITVGRNYSIAPADLTIRDNVVVSATGGDAGTGTARPLIGWGGNDGLPVAGVTQEIQGAFMGRDSWSNLANGDWLVDGPLPAYRTANPNGAALIGVPLIPHDSTSSSGWNALLDSAIAGSHDADYTALGRKLAEFSPKTCLARVWWEFNVDNDGDINPTKFKNAWSRAIPLIRSGFAAAARPGQTIKIVFNSMPDRTTKEALYPGSSVVDVVSYDAYAQRYGSSNPTKQQVIDLTAGYLADLTAWGQSVGKPVALDEWGCWGIVSSGGTTNRGTGDHPEYITQIFDWATNPSNNVAWLCYFNEPGGGVEITLDDVPNARSAFVARAQAAQAGAGGGSGTGAGSGAGGAVQIIKAPTGTNDIQSGGYYNTTALAGLTKGADGVWRRDGVGPQLVKLERADVGIAGDPTETDGTGTSIGGAPGDTGDPGLPGGGTGGGGGTGTAANPGELLKIGLTAGFTKVNIGIGFLAGDPLDRDGDGHVDFTLAEIGNGLIVPGHFEMSDDKQRVRLTVPASAGTTSDKTKNPRTEFRGLAQSGNGSSSHPKEAFDPREGDHKGYARGRVIRAPAGKPEIVMVQTHDSGDDTSMIRYEGGNVVCKIGDSDVKVLSGAWDLDTDYDYGIRITDGSIRFYFGAVGSGFATPIHTAAFSTSALQYYKAGNYLQANETNVDPDEYSVIEMGALMFWHTGDPEPAVALG